MPMPDFNSPEVKWNIRCARLGLQNDITYFAPWAITDDILVSAKAMFLRHMEPFRNYDYGRFPFDEWFSVATFWGTVEIKFTDQAPLWFKDLVADVFNFNKSRLGLLCLLKQRQRRAIRNE